MGSPYCRLTGGLSCWPAKQRALAGYRWFGEIAAVACRDSEHHTLHPFVLHLSFCRTHRHTHARTHTQGERAIHNGTKKKKRVKLAKRESGGRTATEEVHAGERQPGGGGSRTGKLLCAEPLPPPTSTDQMTASFAFARARCKFSALLFGCVPRTPVGRLCGPDGVGGDEPCAHARPSECDPFPWDWQKERSSLHSSRSTVHCTPPHTAAEEKKFGRPTAGKHGGEISTHTHTYRHTHTRTRWLRHLNGRPIHVFLLFPRCSQRSRGWHPSRALPAEPLSMTCQICVPGQSTASILFSARHDGKVRDLRLCVKASCSRVDSSTLRLNM